MKIRAVIERHVEENGCRNFKNSSLVISESNSQSLLKTNTTTKSKGPNVIFDINKSNIILLKKQKESYKIVFGRKVKVEDSDDDED